jgi:hypothetical protein
MTEGRRTAPGAAEDAERTRNFEFDVDRYSAPHYLEALTELTSRPGVDVQSITFATHRNDSKFTLTIIGGDANLVYELGHLIEKVREVEPTKGQKQEQFDNLVHDAATLIFDAREK